MPNPAPNKWKKAGSVIKIQNQVVKILSQVPHGLDSTTFFSPTIPSCVKLLPPLFASAPTPVPTTLFRSSIKLAITALQHNDSIGDSKSIKISDIDELVNSIPNSNSNSTSTSNSTPDPYWDHAAVSKLVTAVVVILGKAVSARTKLTIVTKDLEQMMLPQDFVKDLVSALRNARFSIEDHARTINPKPPSLSNFRWRVDVAISTDSLSKVFKPSILAEMTLSDGKIKTFEIPVSEFHTLRYNVAKCLRDMEEVERHPIMRLAFEADKKLFEERETS
ncbi:hypothetical protein ScalyP_jg7771 [Parmales sp. scaly parma]|nr:hypothetical protein ScalyP_jg7771 [Parmales sp. scaly parma]